MGKISRKKAEELVLKMVELGSLDASQAEPAIQSLIDDGLVGSGKAIHERTFVSPEQQEFYLLGKQLIEETKDFWKENSAYQKLTSKTVVVVKTDENGNPVTENGSPVTKKISTVPQVTLKNNKLLMDSFEELIENQGDGDASGFDKAEESVDDNYAGAGVPH